MDNKRDIKKLTLSGKTLINNGEDFKLGHFNGVKLNDNNEIILDDDSFKGSYISPGIYSKDFKNLVASWNALTPKGSMIEVFFKVRVDDKWSKWFSYGKWSSDGYRGSIKGQRDEIAKMDIDTLTVLNNKIANGLKFKVDIIRDKDHKESPKIKAIYATLDVTNKSLEGLDKYRDWVGELDVPRRSQMVIPEIGNRICSPTSLSMVMEYYGEKLDTLVVCENVLDKGSNIYGNWSYNAAFPGSLGFISYVDRFVSVNEIKEKLSEGVPVVASIKTKDKDELEGSPQSYPGGHLLVVIGFKVKDTDEYVIVNDPAAPSHDTVKREYKLSEFMKAWSKVVYILIKDSK